MRLSTFAIAWDSLAFALSKRKNLRQIPLLTSRWKKSLKYFFFLDLRVVEPPCMNRESLVYYSSIYSSLTSQAKLSLTSGHFLLFLPRDASCMCWGSSHDSTVAYCFIRVSNIFPSLLARPYIVSVLLPISSVLWEENRRSDFSNISDPYFCIIFKFCIIRD